MKITVCVKQVPLSSKVAMDMDTKTIRREGTELILNPFDEFAVEEAVRIKETFGAKLTSISMGIPTAIEMLKETISLGFDDAYLLSDRAFAGADTLATATALAAGIKAAGFPDLIICGKMAIDGDTAQVGPMLADILSIPHVTDISHISGITSQEIQCIKMTDDGYVNISVKLPALITVTKEINVPRIPSITGIIKSVSYPITTLNAKSIDVDTKTIGLSGSPTQVVSTALPDQTKNSIWLKGTMDSMVLTVLEKVIKA